jgi:arginine decarboxylase-like protein
MQDVCMEKAIAAPCIVSESGRALASHHAVMIFDVLSRLAYTRTQHCLVQTGV